MRPPPGMQSLGPILQELQLANPPTNYPQMPLTLNHILHALLSSHAKIIVALPSFPPLPPPYPPQAINLQPTSTWHLSIHPQLQ